MKQRLIMIAVIVVIVLGGGTYAFRQLMGNQAEKTQGPLYATQPVVRGDITVAVEATGNLNPSKGGGLQMPGYRGGPMPSGSFTFIVDEVLAQEGDAVKQGEIVVRLSSPDLVDKIDELEGKIENDKKYLSELLSVSPDRLNQMDFSGDIKLYSPIDGRVIGLQAKEGEELKEGQIVAKIADDSHYRLAVKLSMAEFTNANIMVGQPAAVRFFDYSGVMPAKVTDVNPDPIPEDISKIYGLNNPSYQYFYWIEVEGESPDLLVPGMKANVGLIKPGVKFENSTDWAMDENNVQWLQYPTKVEGYPSEEQVLSKADAVVTKVHVREMQKVEKGTPLVSLAGKDVKATIEAKLEEIRNQEEELRRLQSLFEQLNVTAPMDGIVAYLDAQPGQTRQLGDWIGHIYTTDDMRMGVNLDDMDVLHVSQGSPVKVTLDAVPGKSFEGKVMFVSTMGQDKDGIPQFFAEINVKGGPELRPGMQAKAHIDVGSAKNVLLIPLEAIFEEDGQPKVEVLQADGTVKVASVKLGLMNDRVAEVKSGLKEGELVITGSSADILPSQRLQSDDSFLPGSVNKEEGDAGGKEPGEANTQKAL